MATRRSSRSAITACRGGSTTTKSPGATGKGFVCHAEFNAILNARGGSNLRGCTIYVTLFPCNECAKAIIQTGIKELVYLSDKYAGGTIYLASRKLLEMAGVKVRAYEGKALEIKTK